MRFYNSILRHIIPFSLLILFFGVIIPLSADQVTITDPVFSPEGGIYTSAKQIIINQTEPNSATVYYTTNGNDPVPGTNYTTEYTNPFWIGLGGSGTVTVKAQAFLDEWTPSIVYTNIYTITGQVEIVAPVFGYPGGTYTSELRLQINETNPASASIRYTLNGTDPDLNSPVFPTEGIDLERNHQYNFKVRAFLTDWDPSPVYSSSYLILSEASISNPVFTPTPGTYQTAQSVTFGAANPSGAHIRYTINGDIPQQSDSLYTGSISLELNNQYQLRVRAFANGYLPSPVYSASYNITGTLQLPGSEDLFNPPPGTYAGTTGVTLNTTGLPSGTRLFYTIGDGEPSYLYTAPIILNPASDSLKIRVKAEHDDWESSDIIQGMYQINGAIEINISNFLNPDPGLYTETPTLVSVNENAIMPNNGIRIFYTIDGSIPIDHISNQYTDPISLQTGQHLLKFRVFADNYLPSDVITALYTVTGTLQLPASTVLFNPPPGTYAGTTTITLNTPGLPYRTRLLYTIGDGEPSYLYTAPIILNPSSDSLKIRVKAEHDDWESSDIIQGMYQINGAIEINVSNFLNPDPGLHTESPTLVSVNENAIMPNNGIRIFYTIDGSIPIDHISNQYTDPISLQTGQHLLKFRVFADNYLPSDVITALYTVTGTLQLPASTVLFNPPPGTYAGTTTITLNTPGLPPRTRLLYTIGDGEPSYLYTAPIILNPSSDSLKIRVKAEHDDWESSDIIQGMYQINGAIEINVSNFLNPDPGLYKQSPTYIFVNHGAITPYTGIKIRYTRDGSTPIDNDDYAFPDSLGLETGQHLLKFRVFADNSLPSDVITASYTITGTLQLNNEYADPKPDTYANPITVKLSFQTDPPGASLRYTQNGTEPVESSPILPDILYLSEGVHQITVRAFMDGWLASDTQSFRYDIKSYPSSLNLDHTIEFEGKKKRYYRLVGIPGAQQLAITQFTQGDLNYHWRAYHEAGGLDDSGSELIPWANANAFSFGPGKAYWMLSKYPLHISVYTPSVMLDDELCYQIPLHPGWNIISSPFEASRKWGEIQDANGFKHIAYRFKENYIPVEADSLFEPFEGYYYFNASQTNATLKIPWIQKENSDAKNVLPAYRVTLHTEDGTDHIVMGLYQGALETIDEYDQLAPPDYFSQQMLKLEDGRLKHEYRPPSNQIFNFVINPGEETVHTLHTSAQGHPGQAYLWDKSNDAFIPLTGEYEHHIQPNHLSYAIVFGSGQFIEDLKDELIPETVLISPNWPNPFRKHTNIKAKFNHDAQVDVDIYNIRGQKVASLAKSQKVSRGTTEWILDSEHLANGIYLCRIRWHSESSKGEKTIKMTRLGK